MVNDAEQMRDVAPAHPAAPYIGGKKQLSRRICAIIETTSHELYAEAFVGMGGVFLRRRFAPRVEVIKDRDPDVSNFFRILQRHYQAFMDMLKWQLTSRAEFERLAAQNPEQLTDLERAARFIYLQRLSFGGKSSSRSFGIDTTGPARFDTTRLGPILEDIHDRLSGVTIECLDWRDFLERWDRPGTLFYLDPPYFGTEGVYQASFPRSDHKALANALAHMKGQFLLTMNDCEETRSIYGGFPLERVELTYTAGGSDKVKRAGEIIAIGLKESRNGLLSGLLE
jgi:DNA adenine methylase